MKTYSFTDDDALLECSNGEWVKAEDVAELEEQITAYQLRVDNDLLRLKAAYSLAGSE